MTRHIYLNDNRALAYAMPTIDAQATASHAHFESIGACVEYLQAIPRADYWADYFFTSASDDCPMTGRAAIDHCLNGWREGAERVARLRERINASRPALNRISRWDVAGAVPSIPRYYGGNPLFMKRNATAETRKRPVLTLINHMGGFASVPANCFVNRAAVVAAIVDAIETTGFSLHLIGASYSAKTLRSGAAFAHETAITLKEPGRHLDISALAFAAGHVGFFRRIVFGVRCADSVNRQLTDSLGSTQDYRSRPDNCFILPSMNTTYSLFSTEETAATKGLETMIRILAEQGCPAFREHAAYNDRTEA